MVKGSWQQEQVILGEVRELPTFLIHGLVSSAKPRAGREALKKQSNQIKYKISSTWFGVSSTDDGCNYLIWIICSSFSLVCLKCCFIYLFLSRQHLFSSIRNAPFQSRPVIHGQKARGRSQSRLTMCVSVWARPPWKPASEHLNCCCHGDRCNHNKHSSSISERERVFLLFLQKQSYNFNRDCRITLQGQRSVLHWTPLHT